MALEVFDEHARVVEAHRLVVQQAAGELDWVVELHPRRLVRRPREGSGMRAAEAVDGEALDRAE